VQARAKRKPRIRVGLAACPRAARRFERGHYDVSVACAEHGLWPTVRGADPATAVLADGFSCRTQIEAGHLGRKRIHLAQLLAGMLGENPDGRKNQS
jgi:hypothetical protein